MSKRVLSALVLITFLGAAVPASAEDSPELKKWKECATKVKKDYPVPPGNVNEQNQMVQMECGARPSK